MVFFACFVLLVVLAQSLPVSDTTERGQLRKMKIFPEESRNIPIYSRHVRDTEGWKVQPNINRDQDGNTAGSVRVQKDFGNHEVHAGASKVFSGPNRGEPSYNVGATFNW
ncbi:coleoptericin-like [Harmonia axyridis]|uniref:coleoptericin-like n=1 Tax=Harmonia axyridis TaxID=115357 RepID=UPI001E27519D|nr:coleoptericin-like [Harmonia axyridis]